MSDEQKSFPVFTGGQKLISGGAAVGVIGLGLTAVRGFQGEDGVKTALFSYLAGFAYWFGIALAALMLLMIWHASKARWAVVVRRLLEVMAATLIIFPVLFIPIVLGLKHLYPWANPEESMGEEVLKLIHFRHVYLNVPFFLGRAAFFFFVFVLFSQLFLRWSTRQDQTGAPELTIKAYKLGPGGLPLMGLALTFAAFDWLMSLSMQWFSSMWGVYYFAGSLVSAIGLLIILTVSMSNHPSFAGAVKTAHQLSLGKFLLAFTAFWGYIFFSQYMLTWVANLPDTAPYLISRSSNGWQWVSILLMAGQFGIPFFILLSRKVKMRPRQITVVALWILTIHYVDMFLIVMPQVRPQQPMLDWSNVTAFFGVGGLTLAAGAFILRGRHAIPVKDPFLAESLAYSKMM